MRYHAPRILVTALLLGAFLCSGPGCATKEPEPKRVAPRPAPAQRVQPPRQETPKPPPMFVHTVRWPGETLSIIAKWYTGKLTNWEILAKANPGLDPNRIRPGDEIRIPKGLMTTSDPMPRDYPSRFVQQPEPGPEPKPEAAVGEAAPAEDGQEAAGQDAGQDATAAEPQPQEPAESGILFGPKGYEE